MWGEGKTTVLNFIEKELAKHDGVITVQFNPWLFQSQQHLLRSFFETMADALGKSISSHKESIGRWLQQYGTLLSPLSIALGGVDPGKGTSDLGETLSSVDLAELRGRIENLLKEEEKRVVVLMDDIDRLDRSEIQSVFKLIKLSADFSYTTYLVAFDKEMVAGALGEKYGSGDVEAGRNFRSRPVRWCKSTSSC